MSKTSVYIRFLFLLLLLSFVVGTAMAERVVVTSGRVVYDAFGRVIATYHPTVDDSVYGDSVDCYSNAVDAVAPTRTKYDVLDRPVKVIYPDETETNTRYYVEGRALVTRVTDALGHTSDTHVTASGKTLRSVRKCGIDLNHWLEGFHDPVDSVRNTVETIKTHPLMPAGMTVRGFIIDSTTGALQEVK